jgi:hypothetical protein
MEPIPERKALQMPRIRELKVQQEEFDRVEQNIRAAIAFGPRAADRQAIEMLLPDNAGFRETVETTAEFIWDHHLGEPTVPNFSDVTRAVLKAIETGETELDLSEFEESYQA